jgi:hypothetical protein
MVGQGFELEAVGCRQQIDTRREVTSERRKHRPEFGKRKAELETKTLPGVIIAHEAMWTTREAERRETLEHVLTPLLQRAAIRSFLLSLNHIQA